jgi:hypothetical protein
MLSHNQIMAAQEAHDVAVESVATTPKFLPLKLVTHYYLVMEDYEWEIGLCVDEYTDDLSGDTILEFQSVQDGKIFQANEDLCILLPRQMTIGEAIKEVENLR